MRVEWLEDRAVPAAGDLDPSFGNQGVASITNQGLFRFVSGAQDAEVQSDGRILLFGTNNLNTLIGDNRDFAVARLTPSGVLDTSFGEDGRVLIPFDLGSDPTLGGAVGRAIELQADGKIVVAGSATTDISLGGNSGLGAAHWAVARLNSNGTLDTTFGTGGKVSFPFNAAGNAIWDMALQPDGRIVLVGGTTSSALFTAGNLSVARLLPDGSFDTSFGGDGRVSVPATDDFYNPNVLLQADGRIVIAGHTPGPLGTRGDFQVIRLQADGTVDDTFGTAGVATTDLGSHLTSTRGVVVGGAALQADGRIVVVGGQPYSEFTSYAGEAGDFIVARFTPDGKLDASFDGDGQAFVAFDLAGENDDDATGVAVQPDGRIVIGGRAQTRQAEPAIYEFAAARLNPDGSLDTTFGTDGKRAYAVNSPSAPSAGGADYKIGSNATIFVTNGKILLAGNDNEQMVAVRLLNDITFNPLPPGPGGGGGDREPPFRARFTVTGAAGQVTVVPVGLDTRVNPGGARSLSILPTTEPYTGVFRSATADVNGDGVADFAVVTGPGAPVRFAVVDGRDRLTLIVPPTPPFAGSADFTGGAFVAAGDIDGDGKAELVFTPDQGGGPRVTVFGLTGANLAIRANFLGIADPNFRGGARAAVGDTNGDGKAEVVVAAGFGGGPRVALYDGYTVLTEPAPVRLVDDFFAFPGEDAVRLRNGAYLAIGDMTGDGYGELIFGGGPGGAPRVFALGGRLVADGNVAGAQANPLANFFVAGNTADRGGVRVAAADFDLDGRADVVTGSGAGSPARVRAYFAGTFPAAAEPPGFVDFAPFGGAVVPDGVYVG
ncbi:MAG: FG-GAP-like repeat-containing protein [Gemmataceae bacterium]|nr:FG-GAP-like repeat-containing protein [Gemmataceae bacterium]